MQIGADLDPNYIWKNLDQWISETHYWEEVENFAQVKPKAKTNNTKIFICKLKRLSEFIKLIYIS